MFYPGYAASALRLSDHRPSAPHIDARRNPQEQKLQARRGSARRFEPHPLPAATLHTRNPSNFKLFPQLLDRDTYADVISIREVMECHREPFHLRRTKEVIVYFSEHQADGSWAAKPVFTKCVPRSRQDGSTGPTSCTSPMHSPSSILAAAGKSAGWDAMLLVAQR